MKKITIILTGILIIGLGLFLIRSGQPGSNSSQPGFVKAPLFSAWSYQTNTQDGLSAYLKPGAVEVKLADSSVSFDLPFANNGISQENNNVVMTGTAGIKTVYAAEPNRLKEEIILPQAGSESKFTIPLKTTNLDIYLTPENLPVFFDPQTKAYRFHIERPFAIDAAGAKTYAANYSLRPKNDTAKTITYPQLPNQLQLLAPATKISLPNQDYVLVLEVDPDWLADPARVYPVTIDPTVVHDTHSEVATGTFNRVINSGPRLTNQITHATGGTVTYADGYAIHSFTSSGTFTPSESLTTQVLVVGGGGGGGDRVGGGGGGGGVIYDDSYDVTAQGYSVTVGDGGAGNTGGTNGSSGADGGNSVFDTLTAIGGGGGGGYLALPGRTGGSGGGGGGYSGGTSGSGTSGQGYNGGAYTANYGAGGGGGSGKAGSNGGSSNLGGAGGDGKVYTITGYPIAYGGGGGGSGYQTTTQAAGGAGGGGIGGDRDSSPGSGTANTGGGGGGRERYGDAGNGGSGIVIIRYYVGFQDTSPNIETNYQELGSDPYTVGLWHFDETSGNALDSSGNSNTGTPTGTAVVPGLLGNSRIFNGSSDYIESPDSTSLRVGTPYFTFESWINPGNITGCGADGNPTCIIFAKEGTYEWALTSTGKIHWAILNTSPGWAWQNTGVVVPTNSWSHIAMTYDGSYIRTYINGQLGNSIAGSGNINHATAQYALRIGARNAPAAASSFFPGKIDEVRISNIARSPEEIRAAALRRPSAVYTSPVIDTTIDSDWNSLSWTPLGQMTGDGETASNSTNLVAQWNFNETSGTTAASGGSCGATCNGTLTNFASTGSQDAAAGTGWTAANRRWGAGALMFDGSDDYIVVTDNNNLDITNQITLEAWIYIKNISADWTFIIHKGDEVSETVPYQITAHDFGSNNDQINCGIADVSSGYYAITLNQWHHIVCTGGPNGLDFYIDSKLIKHNATSPTFIANNKNLWLGKWRNAYDENFSGVLDSVRLYSRALSAAEILSNYNAASINFQTRSSADGTTWESWKPTTSETQIDSFDSIANWTATTPTVSTSSSSLKIEGTGSLKTATNLQADANTVGLWHLDETGGTGAYLKDASGNANHGTPTGTTLTNGVSAKAREFNGSSDLINVGSSINPSVFTLDAWIYPHQVSGDYVIVSKLHNDGVHTNKNFELRISGGKLYAHIPDGSNWNAVTSTQSLIANIWSHVALTYDGSTGYMYINGVRDATTYSGTYSQSTVSVNIGARPDNGGVPALHFDGIIDEVKISNVARSAEEIAESYRMGRDHRVYRTVASTDLSTATKLPLYIASDRKGTFLDFTVGESAFANYEPDANTVGFWHLDEQSGSGAYIKDSSGNANHGTPTGTTFTQGKIGKAHLFNGSSSYINLANSALLSPGTGNLTVSAWVNPSAVNSADHRIYDDYGSDTDNLVLLRLNSSNYFESFYRDSAANSSVATGTTIPAVGYWYYVVAVKEGTTSHLYVNGKLEKSTNNASLGAITNSDGLSPSIGRTNSGPAAYFSGIIDEVRVDNVARTAEEIRQAYEVGKRTHSVTIDFKAKLDSGNLITGSGDTSFTVDETAYGASSKAPNLFVDDILIVKENYDGTEYLAQGQVSAATPATGAVTVTSWDGASTFPSGGFTVNATVFKWQREYMDISSSMSGHRDTITQLTYRLTDGAQAANIWLDDLRATTPYLSTPTGSTITSTHNRYFQYRAIFSSTDPAVSASLTSTTLDYFGRLNVPTNCRLNYNQSGSILVSWIDNSDSESGFEIERDVDGGGFADLQNTSVNSTSHLDNTISTNHLYTYRVRAFYPETPTNFSDWCTTSQMPTGTSDNFQLGGLNMQGIKIY